MIEKAARAMEARLYAMEQSEDGPDCYRRLGMAEYEQLAASVLGAVRVPGLDARYAGRSAAMGANPMSDYSVAIGSAYTAMIDHILNEPSSD